MGLRLGAACRSRFVARTHEKKASDEPSTKEAIEAVRFRASLFQARLSIETVSWFFPIRENKRASFSIDVFLFAPDEVTIVRFECGSGAARDFE